MNSNIGEARYQMYLENRQRREAKRMLRNLIEWTWGPPDHAEAVRVCWIVSGFDSCAVDKWGKGSVGLFGIFPFEAGLTEDLAWQLFNPVRNVAAAHRLWCTFGWKRWNVPPDLPAATIFEETKEG